MNINNYIGKQIRDRRKHIDMSQLMLAQLVGVSDKAVSSWEVGRAMPSVELLAKVCDVIGLRVGKVVQEGWDAEVAKRIGQRYS